MAVITLPTTFRPTDFLMRLSTNQAGFAAPFGGSEQVVDRLNDRWLISLTIPHRGADLQASIEAFANAMRGMTNTCLLWHMQRPQPRGTMRGSPVCGAATKGAGSVTLSSVAPATTMLAGDMFSAGGLLLQVSDDATANGSGVIVLPLANRLRKAIAGSSAVTWYRPTAPFRMMSVTGVRYQPGYAEEVAFDFAEVPS